MGYGSAIRVQLWQRQLHRHCERGKVPGPEDHQSLQVHRLHQGKTGRRWKVGLIDRPLLNAAPVLILLLAGCRHDPPARSLLSFSDLRKIEISGYSGHSMEPFLSPNGEILLFNNLNSAPE